MKKNRKYLQSFLLWGMAVILLLPVYLLIDGSLQSSDELMESLAPVLADANTNADWHILPLYPTLVHYLEALFDRPEFYAMLKNSLQIVFFTLFGQLVIGVPSAWAFSRFRFPGKNFIFLVYMILMMMPFSVTMFSTYLVLKRLSLFNSLWGIVLPGMFSTFPVFIIFKGFEAIPKGMLEAARVDGAGELMVFFRIGLPLGSAGISSAVILSFLEYYSLMEQPLAFLEDRALWPLSLYLPQIGLEEAGYAFAAGMVALIPAFLVFFLGQDYLEKGIVSSGMKE